NARVPAAVPFSAPAAARRGLCYVRDSGNSLRKLRASIHGFVPGDRARISGRIGYIVSLSLSPLALQRDRTLPVVRHREKERDHGCRFCSATTRRRLAPA